MSQHFLTAILVAVSGIAFGQSGLTWSEPIQVADGSYDNIRPRIEVLDDGNPIILWGKSGPSNNFVARWNGSGFTDPVPVSPAGVPPNVVNWSGTEMATFGNTVFVAFKKNTGTQHLYLVQSADGGTTWSDTVRIENLLAPKSARFPTVAVTADGNPQVGFMEFENGWLEPSMAVARSNDGGLSFGTPVTAGNLAPGEPCDCCQPTLVAAGNEVSLLFRNNDNNIRDIWLSHSTDGGNTFAEQIDIDGANWNLFACPSSTPDGVIFGSEQTSVWMSGGSGVNRAYYGVVDLTSMAILGNEMVNDNVPADAEQNNPRITGNGDTLGIVYQERLFGSTNIMAQYSVSGIAGLSAPDTVNVQMLGQQERPDIAYANGRFHVVYEDNGTGLLMYRWATGGLLTGVKAESLHEQTIRTWPNPASDVLSIEVRGFSGKQHISLTDAYGQQVFAGQVEATNTQLDVRSYAPGCYFLTISDGTEHVVQKVLIQ